MPSRAGIDADFYPGYFRVAAPGGPANLDGRSGGNGSTVFRSRDFRFDLLFRERSEGGKSGNPLPISVVDRLIITGKWFVRDDDTAQPFYGRHRIPAGHDRAQRKTVRGRKLLSIHRVREQHIGARFLERQTARKTNPAGGSRRISDLAFIRPFEDDLNRRRLS